TRSDFLDRLNDDGFLGADMSRALVFLPPVNREGLREALQRPLEATGYRFEDDALVDEMLDDLAQAKSPLPLLQFTASKLWEARDRAEKTLTRASYTALGGVAGALSAHADTVIAGLSARDQRLSRAVLLRLVTPERTRAVVAMSDLAALSGGDAVDHV